MLATQVEYWKLQESKRHNFATENLQGESNAIQREQVNVNWYTAKENQRHNKEQEAIGWTNANENIRHNQATESLGWAEFGETSRHNRQMEGIGWKNAYANVEQAQAATRNAMTNWGNYQLAVEMQPYKIDNVRMQTSMYQSNAGKNMVEIQQAPYRMLLDTVSTVGNLWNSMGRTVVSGLSRTKGLTDKRNWYDQAYDEMGLP